MLPSIKLFLSLHSSLHGLHISGAFIMEYWIWIVLFLFIILSHFLGSDYT